MARKFLVPIDLSKLELQNAAVHNLATDPASPALGQIYYNTSSNRIKVKGASAFLEIPTSGTIVNADIASGAAISYSKLSLSGSITDADLAGSISNSKLATNPLARANHTGTQLASTISDFDTQVRTSRLDQMAAPTASVAFGGQKITGLADPTSAQDAATKIYVDNAVVGIDWKPSVRAIATTNITLSGTQTIDGVVLVANDRVLVAGQTTGANNGIYLVAAGAWTRASDVAAGSSQNAFAVFVEEGTNAADTGWVLTNDGVVTIGTTALTFTQFSGGGSIVAGNGISKSGNTISVLSANAARIAVSGSGVDLATVTQTNSSGTAGINFVQSHTIDSYGRVTGTVSADVRDASTTQKGIASFDTASFSVTTGAVSIKAAGVSNSQLANSSITVSNGTGISVSGSPVSLGGTVTITNSGVTSAVAGTGVSVSGATGAVTISIGQAVATNSTPTFAGLTISGGKATFAAPAAGYASILLTSGASDPTTLAVGDLWVNGTALKFSTTTGAGGVKTVAFTDSNITGTSSGISGSQTANTVYAAPNGTAGTATFRSLVAADIPNLDASKITSGTLASARGGALRFAADVGDGTSTSINITHSLGTLDVVVNVYDKSTGATVECDVNRTSTSVVQLVFAAAPTSAQYRVVVLA